MWDLGRRNGFDQRLERRSLESELQLEAFRNEVRSWLEANLPRNWRDVCATQEGFLETQRAWFKKLVEAGYATPHWPAGWPGGGRSLAEQKIIYEEIARADGPRLILYFVATYHAASTLLEWGTPEQQAKYLPRILEGEIWCQGFSEPNAGSDLAAVATRAELKGDRYVINGQKIWSTMAQYADRCLLLARTASDGPKQAGLTFLLLDMKGKGVTARPINQITGDEEFAEVFFDDAEVPVEDRLGPDGDGWAVAQSTLASERGLTLMELSQRMRGALWRLASAIEQQGRQDDQGIQRDFGRLATRIDACCALADQYLQRRIAGQEQLGDASIIKLMYARTLRDYTRLGLRVGGMDAQYWTPLTYGGAQETGNWMVDFMNSYNWSIAGGSDEIQRNIISERLLGMPREPKSWQLERGA
jgi:alkylation response protein AidB-like acyl-CoA dehydrogenase